MATEINTQRTARRYLEQATNPQGDIQKHPGDAREATRRQPGGTKETPEKHIEKKHIENLLLHLNLNQNLNLNLNLNLDLNPSLNLSLNLNLNLNPNPGPKLTLHLFIRI